MENSKACNRAEKAAFTWGIIFLTICLLSTINAYRFSTCPVDDYGCNYGSTFWTYGLLCLGLLPSLFVWTIATIIAIVEARKTPRRFVVATLAIGPIVTIGLASIWSAISTDIKSDQHIALAVISAAAIMANIPYIYANRARN